MKIFTKSPTEVLDYSVDLTHWLSNGDTVISRNWTVPTGITNLRESVEAEISTIFLTGGTIGNTYDITLVSNTGQGRVQETTFQVRIEASKKK